MAAAAVRKLKKDRDALDLDPPPGIIYASPAGDDIFTWHAVIDGPADTPFEGGTFKLKLQYPPTYPAQAPLVWFYSKMFHPNVYADGRICLDILEKSEKWDPAYDVGGVLCAIQALLGDPNPTSPANGEANGLFLRDPKAYKERVAEVVAVSVQDLDIDFDSGENQNQGGDEADQVTQDMMYALQLNDELLRN